mgnify:CR=1 FL=1
MRTSKELSPKFHKAFDKLQSAITGVKKDGLNPHFKNKYTTLESVIDYVKPILSKNGFTIMQSLDTEIVEGQQVNSVTTRLTHIETAEWVESVVPCPVKDKNDPQKLGSAITYGRRYGMKTTCLMSEVDDDAHHASTPKPKPIIVSELDAMVKRIKSIKDIKQIDKARAYLETATEFTADEKDSLDKVINDQAGKVMQSKMGAK